MFRRIPIPYLNDACAYFKVIADMPWPVWLDSAGQGRFDILCAHPVKTLRNDGSRTEVRTGSGEIRIELDDPFTLIRRELGTQLPAVMDVPFAGGALGYWSYDLGLKSMQLHLNPAEENTLPEMMVGIYDWAIVLDHREHQAYIATHCRYASTEGCLHNLLSLINQKPDEHCRAFNVIGKVHSNFTYESYAKAFARIKEYLKAGDCYQVNLAQRFSVAASGDALLPYMQLRNLSPAPYSAFLRYPGFDVLCGSPEKFLTVKEGQVETSPIKGTRKRGRTAGEDQSLIEDLRQHPKDRAENLMIVDLLRNDLSKHCRPGTVQVPRLFEIESFANVHHMVTTITGQLAEGHDALHLLKDCFPGGSITGAPKRRAMQIINELEPHARGIYCGSIGYVGYDGNMDTNIVIRSLIYSGNELAGWAGGGIVAESDVDAEYRETFDKASAILELLGQIKPEHS